MKILIGLLFLLAPFRITAQEFISPKPGIAINGVPCLIQNTIWSCVPVTCDSIIIEQGDSIEFCTFQEIYLNTDTAYWYECRFSGCSNLPDSFRIVYPTQTPLCYWPRWDSAGIFQVEILYNGWLSAYPQSDCYVQGPSRWFVNVIVLPAAGVNEIQMKQSVLTVSPNPGRGVYELGLTDNSEILFYTVTDVFGKIISTGESQYADLTDQPSGVYFVQAFTSGRIWNAQLVNVCE